MSNFSILSINFLQASYLLAAGVFVIMANVSTALSKPAEQLAANSTNGEHVTSVSSPEAVVSESAVRKDCSGVTNNTACHPENRPLPVQSLKFGGPR